MGEPDLVENRTFDEIAPG
jgi:phosphate acetyltransferase